MTEKKITRSIVSHTYFFLDHKLFWEQWYVLYLFCKYSFLCAFSCIGVFKFSFHYKLNLYVFKVFCNCVPLNFQVCFITTLLSYFKTSFICYLLSYIHAWFVRYWYVWILDCYVYKHKEIRKINYWQSWLGKPITTCIKWKFIYQNFRKNNENNIIKIKRCISIVCSSTIWL